MLFIVGIRSCLSVFQLYSFYSSAFAIFWNTPLGLVAIPFGYYLWSNATGKTKRKIGESLAPKELNSTFAFHEALL